MSIVSYQRKELVQIMRNWSKLAYELGEFVAEVMLKGIIHPDMQLKNISSDPPFKFVDFADVQCINMPSDLFINTNNTDQNKNIRLLTESLFSRLDQQLFENFLYSSYFRAGFTAKGGLLGNFIFFNAANKGYFSIPNAKKKLKLKNPELLNNIEVSYNISHVQKDNVISSIDEWKKIPLSSITLNNFSCLESYYNSAEVKKCSIGNRYYLDCLYFNRCYMELPICVHPNLIYNMAESALSHRFFFTAYGLLKKGVSMLQSSSDLIQFYNQALNKNFIVQELAVNNYFYIEDLLNLDLLELLWILNDLDALAITVRQDV